MWTLLLDTHMKKHHLGILAPHLVLEYLGILEYPVVHLDLVYLGNLGNLLALLDLVFPENLDHLSILELRFLLEDLSGPVYLVYLAVL
jgi:hypothetical protein